jgi:CRP/FNR family transcriptional regulator
MRAVPPPSTAALAVEQAIESLPLYRRLKPDDRVKLAAVSALESFPRGSVVFLEGDGARSVHIVVSGRVKVAKLTPAGREVILDMPGPGDPIGAVAAFEGFDYPATATATIDSVCLVTGRDAFFALLEAHPSLVRGLLSGLTLRLVQLTQRLAELSGGRIEARMARLLCKLADEQGIARDGGLFVPVKLTRQEIADLCATTVETAIRVMSRWGKEGLVVTERDGFRIQDRSALEVVALS